MDTEKMQLRTKVSYRKWQLTAHHMGDFPYGACPKCGVAGNPQYDEPSGEDNIRNEWFECDTCKVDYFYQTSTSYRFGGIDNDR